MGFDVFNGASSETLTDTIEATKDLTVVTEDSDVANCSTHVNTTCPSPADITINTTTINIASDPSLFKQEPIVFSSLGKATLAATPVSTTSLQLYINGIMQTMTTDYVVNGAVITLATNLAPTYTYVATAIYLAPESGGISIGVSEAGAIAGLAQGTSLPTGWLLCDGASVLKATYPDLFDAIGYDYGGSGTNFNLPDIDMTYYDSNSELVTSPAMIKT
jgi:hypothetical protein